MDALMSVRIGIAFNTKIQDTEATMASYIFIISQW